jgi:hypothetical protein
MSDKDKQRLVILVMVTVAVLGLFYQFVIKTEQRLIAECQSSITNHLHQADLTREWTKNWEKHAQELAASSNLLHRLEASMPNGDIYRWTLRNFLRREAMGVEVVSVDPPRPADALIPATARIQVPSLGEDELMKTVEIPLPYQTVVFNVSGKATFHNFGRYLAAIENEYLHMRLQRLELDPAAPDALESPDANRLVFQLDLLTLSLSPPPIPANN